MVETVALVFGSALLAVVAVLVRHRFWPMRPEAEPREDVAEYIAMMVGVLYALVLGLSLVSVWDARSRAADHVRAEASAAHQIDLLAAGLPDDSDRQVRTAVAGYVRHVVRVELPAMTQRQPLGPEGWELLRRVRAANQVPDGATAAQQVTMQETLAQLAVLDDARRGRESDTLNSLAPMLWFGLLTGGLLTVLFMFLFGIKRSFTHVVMVMGLTALITLTVLLVYQLDRPFSGLLAVDLSPFTRYFPGVQAGEGYGS